MKMKQIERSIEINNQTLTLQFGKFAQQATSSVLATMGDTSMLVTVVAGQTRDDIDYFPLSVEYVEKLYAGGRIKGSRWVKKEGRPTDEAILKGRLIDRSIRPLFPKSYRRDVQIIITMLSVDAAASPEIIGAIAVSAALHVSSIPFMIPISTMRIGYTEGSGEYIVNPSVQQMEESALDLIVSSSKDKVLMIETEASQLSESVIEEGIKLAKVENGKIIDFIEALRKEIGVEKEIVPEDTQEQAVYDILKKNFMDDVNAIIDAKASKETSDPTMMNDLVARVMEKQGDTPEVPEAKVSQIADAFVKKNIKERILKTKTRLDGRKADEVRPLSIEVGILPRVHGTGLFQRGDTQVLSIATLGSPTNNLITEDPLGEKQHYYIHHYNMPPYTVGETGRIGSSSRREIGHGALAEKALRPVLPNPEEFPYTIRVVSEVLSSNGSTSMASTCGSTLAMMDAGVPIKAPISGIAMGLLSNSDDDYMILTDIMGIEDFSGEMDFKMTGSKEGVTAIQLDVKNTGLTDKMIAEIMVAAKKTRLHIMDAMMKVIDAPRAEVSKYAPQVIKMFPPEDKIGEIIGPGGKNIKAMVAKTKTEINVGDDGVVTISGANMEGVEEARRMIEAITKEPESGEEYEGTVKRLMNFGAFVEILPGKEGLVHVSKMSKEYVKDPNDVVKVGQTVHVKVIEVDNMGRINLTMVD